MPDVPGRCWLWLPVVVELGQYLGVPQQLSSRLPEIWRILCHQLLWRPHLLRGTLSVITLKLGGAQSYIHAAIGGLPQRGCAAAVPARLGTRVLATVDRCHAMRAFLHGGCCVGGSLLGCGTVSGLLAPRGRACQVRRLQILHHLRSSEVLALRARFLCEDFKEGVQLLLLANEFYCLLDVDRVLTLLE